MSRTQDKRTTAAVACVRAGIHSVAEAAAAYKVHRVTITRALRRAGIERQKPGRKLGSKNREKVAKLVEVPSESA
jgi:transposase